MNMKLLAILLAVVAVVAAAAVVLTMGQGSDDAKDVEVDFESSAHVALDYA